MLEGSPKLAHGRAEQGSRYEGYDLQLMIGAGCGLQTRKECGHVCTLEVGIRSQIRHKYSP